MTRLGNSPVPEDHNPSGTVTASIHSTGDGSRLLSVDGLDEMAFEIKDEDFQKFRLSRMKRISPSTSGSI